MNPRSLLITLSIFLLPFLSMVSAAVPGNWAAGVYAVGSLVIHDSTTYIATQTVTASQSDPKTTTAYWSSLDTIAGDKDTPTGQPSEPPPNADEVLSLNVPSDTNDTSGTGGTADTIQIFSLSTRAFFSSDGMSASLNLAGSSNEAKKVMFRVKGPSMNSNVIKGAKLADPKITLQHKTSDGWVKVVESSTFGAAYTDENLSYTNVTSNHVDRHTGNNLEPMVVFELEEGTYSCVIGSDIVGGEGNAILEIYTVD